MTDGSCYTVPKGWPGWLAFVMPKKKATPAKKKLRQDANEIAHRVMREATGQAPKTLPPEERSEDEKDPEAVERGAKGGKKGGKARWKKKED